MLTIGLLLWKVEERWKWSGGCRRYVAEDYGMVGWKIEMELCV